MASLTLPFWEDLASELWLKAKTLLVIYLLVGWVIALVALLSGAHTTWMITGALWLVDFVGLALGAWLTRYERGRTT